MNCSCATWNVHGSKNFMLILITVLSYALPWTGTSAWPIIIIIIRSGMHDNDFCFTCFYIYLSFVWFVRDPLDFCVLSYCTVQLIRIYLNCKLYRHPMRFLFYKIVMYVVYNSTQKRIRFYIQLCKRFYQTFYTIVFFLQRHGREYFIE